MTNLLFHDTTTKQKLVPVYEESENKYYLFLPSSTSVEDVAWELPNLGGKLSFSSGKKTFGDELADIPVEEEVTISASSLFYSQSALFEVLQCGGAASLSIEAQHDLLEFLHESRSNRSDVKAVLCDSDGNVLLEDYPLMYGRGHSTWWMGDKRPYNLKFSNPVSVGPFEEVSKLCLFAEYYDRSKMRNALAFHAGEQLEIPYGSPYMYVDLFINGEYRGLYGLTTKQTFSLAQENGQIKAVFTITSSSSEFDFWPKLWNNPVRVLFGDLDDTWETIYQFEKKLKDQDWESCSEMIDMNSFAKKYVMDEFFANTDVGYASQYFYLDQENILHCMLPWDYDLTMGNTFFYYNNKVAHEMKAYSDIPNWYALLLENSEFRAECTGILETYYTDSFLESLRVFLMDTSTELYHSWNCDMIRWDQVNLQGDKAIRNLSIRDYPEYFLDFLKDRRTFLLDYFKNLDDYCRVSFDGDWKANFCIPKGSEFAPYLDGASILKRFKSSNQKPQSGESPPGWYTEDGLRPEDISIVTEDILFLPKEKG